MLDTAPVHFGASWARAASRVARVTTVRLARQIVWPSAGDLPYFGKNPDADGSYELLQSPLHTMRPARLLRRPADLHLNLRLVRAVRHVEKAVGPVDCLHSHFAAIWDVETAARALGIPLVHTEHSSAFLFEQPEAKKRLSRAGLRRARRLFASAATVICVSEHLRRAIVGRKLVGNFKVVPNPVDTELFAPTPFPPTSDGIELVSVGRLAPEKNPELLLRAFALALRKNPKLRLTMLGRGPLEAAVRGSIAELGIAGRVECLAVPNEQMPSRLAKAHLFVTATKIETFGIAVAEALACGRPVIAPRVGALPDLVSDNGGILVPPNDVERLAHAILEGVQRLERWNPAELAAIARARWSDESVAAGLTPIYEAALRARRSSSNS